MSREREIRLQVEVVDFDSPRVHIRQSPPVPGSLFEPTDGTSGKETYGAGRFMYIPMPENGTVRVDFNKSYSPPCAFNNFATCPLPPFQNRLTVRIDAGEKSYAGSHH